MAHQEKHVLERNELCDLFSATPREDGESSHWIILHDKVAQDNDHGRTLIQFVAQLSQ